MKLVIWIILVEIGILICFTIKSYLNKSLTTSKTAEYLTIFGIVFGLTIYFDLAPQYVKLTKEKSLKIGSLEAIEKVSRKGRSVIGTTGYPHFFFSTYIINTGELPVTDAVLQFSFENEPSNFYPYGKLSGYVFDDINTLIKNPVSLDWLSDSSGNNVIHGFKGDDYFEIALPPILANKSVSVIVGFDYHLKDQLKNPLISLNIDSLINGNLTVRIIEKEYYETGDSNYKDESGKKEEIFDSKKIKFRKLTFRDYSRSEF
jgi:hypothetical protein